MRFITTLAASFLGTLLGLGLLFFFGLMFLFALASTSEQAPSVRPNSILVADLKGSFPETVSGDPIAQAFGGEPSMDLHDVSRALRMAASDDRIDGLWLRMGDVRASWASLEAIRRGIEQVREAGKLVVASSGTYYMAEDELFLASAADSIVLDPESMFEFNGFALQVTFFKRLMDRAGVSPNAVRAGRFKSAVEPYTRESLSAENEAQLQALVDGIEDRFVEEVAEGRSMDAEDLRILADQGHVMTARAALDAGLVDQLTYADQTIAYFGEDPRTISLRRYARTSASAAGLRSGRDGEIAVVLAEGDIVPGGNGGLQDMNSGSIGAATFSRAMRQAREREDVDAVVVRINSPGGYAPAADAMLREIELTLEEKPVLVSMGGMAASGGYWIAAPADTIVAEELTLTGSIGVFGMMLDISELMEERIGITVDGVQTGPSADMMSGFRSMTQQERAALETSVDQTYDHFLELVAEGRGMTVDEVDQLAQGRVWTGADAKDRGLVDVLGGLDTAIRLAAERVGLEEGTYRVRETPRPPTFMERFQESLEARALRLAGRAFGTPVALPFRGLVGEVSALSRITKGVQARLPYTVDIN